LDEEIRQDIAIVHIVPPKLITFEPFFSFGVVIGAQNNCTILAQYKTHEVKPTW